jgi:hypothetical protein
VNERLSINGSLKFDLNLLDTCLLRGLMILGICSSAELIITLSVLSVYPELNQYR